MSTDVKPAKDSNKYTFHIQINDSIWWGGKLGSIFSIDEESLTCEVLFDDESLMTIHLTPDGFPIYQGNITDLVLENSELQITDVFVGEKITLGYFNREQFLQLKNMMNLQFFCNLNHNNSN